MKAKSELIRLVGTEAGVEADPSGRQRGRGAYVCLKEDCWREAARRRSLDRALRLKLGGDDWARLRAGILK